MNTRAATLVVVIAVLLAAAAYVLYTKPVAPAGEEHFAWKITQLPESTEVPGMPRTGIALETSSKVYPIGEYDGSCFEIAGGAEGWSLQAGEKSGVICWWAGGGNEVGVFEENGKLVVKEGQLDEGTAETPGFRGNYKTLLEL